MKNPSARDLPLGAAITIVALVLAASVVTGREAPEPQAPSLPAPPPASPAPAPLLAEVDVERLERQRSEREVHDIFSERTRAAALAAVEPAPVVQPEPPPVAAAPPLPFSYLGRLVAGERIAVYLLRNQEMILAEPGEALDASYRLDRISDTAVHFVYLPLGTQQVLSVPAQP